MSRRQLFTGMLSVAAILAIVASVQMAGAEEPVAKEKPQVVGLIFYADWCASCRVLEPRVDEVKKELGDKPIYITRADLTDDAAKAQSRLFANWVGLGDIYEEHAPGTGFMLLIDPEEKTVLSRLTREHSEEEIRQAIDNALAQGPETR